VAAAGRLSAVVLPLPTQRRIVQRTASVSNAELNRLLRKVSSTLDTFSTPRLINIAGFRIVWMHQCRFMTLLALYEICQNYRDEETRESADY
jgi:hypothetical protein